MFPKTYSKKLCLFYILTLLLWGAVSGASSASEIAESVCGADESYVNHSSSAITPVDKTFPVQEYLSARNFCAQETLSAAKGRNIRTLPRSLRHIAVKLPCGSFFTGFASGSGQFLYHRIPSHSPCSIIGIIITNYIHHQDGQKS